MRDFRAARRKIVVFGRRRSRLPRVLIIVQNLPVPLDRRVWLECQALIGAGYQVSVICPKGPNDPAYHEVDGVRIYKYRPAPSTSGALSYLFEFVYSWLRTALLSVKVALRDGFDVIQACNPPDTYWALARIYRVFGKKFVYDQHDLNPEVFLSRFGTPRGPIARLQFAFLTWLERNTYRTADRVIVTNHSYRRVALERGKLAPEHVTVVRSGPSTAQMRPITASPDVRGGRDHLLVYLGIMGPQDGVDIVLRVMDVLVNRWHRHDVQAALLGFGDSYHDLVALTQRLGLEDYVTFTGRVGPREIAKYLSSAHIGISPDPLSPLNDVSTMNKTMEYMSYALPVVSFDLAETRVSGGDAIEYVPATADVTDDVIEQFAAAVARLLDDPARRGDLGLAGRRRAETELDWAPQRANYLAVFDELTGHVSAASDEPATDALPVPAWGEGAPIDLTDDVVVRWFAMHRQVPDLVSVNVRESFHALDVEHDHREFPPTVLKTVRPISAHAEFAAEVNSRRTADRLL